MADDFEYAIHFDVDDEEQALSQEGRAVFKTWYVDKAFAERRVEYRGREMPLSAAMILEHKKLRIVPDGLTPDEQQALFADIAGTVMEVGKGEANVLVAVDEAHQVVPDVGEALDDRVIRMLTGGRKKGVEYILCTQRPSNLHDEAYSQMSHAAYFSLTKDVDVAKVNGSAGFNAYDYLPHLEPRQFIFEDLDSGDLHRHSTNDLERQHPHMAPDDGVADEVLRDSVEDADEMRVTGPDEGSRGEVVVETDGG